MEDVANLLVEGVLVVHGKREVAVADHKHMVQIEVEAQEVLLVQAAEHDNLVDNFVGNGVDVEHASSLV